MNLRFWFFNFSIFFFFFSKSWNGGNLVIVRRRFLSRLEAIIFERDEIKKNIFIDQVRANSQFKRIVLISFNENDVIMRRMIKYDNDEQKINVKMRIYRIYREASLKTRNIIYRQKWKRLTEEDEDRRVYEMMIDKKWIRNWKYRFYDHMRRSRHTRNILSIAFKRRTLFEENSDSYFEHRVYRKNQISTVETKSAMKEIIDEIESLTRQMKKSLKKIKSTVEDEKSKEIDNFAKELTRLTNAITMIMSKFAKEMNNWKR